MKQVKFEEKLRELRQQKGAAINAIAQMQSEVKEEISSIDRQVKDLRTRREKLNQKRIILSQQRLQTEQYWGANFRLLQTELRGYSRVSRGKRLGAGQRIEGTRLCA